MEQNPENKCSTKEGRQLHSACSTPLSPTRKGCLPQEWKGRRSTQMPLPSRALRKIASVSPTHAGKADTWRLQRTRKSRGNFTAPDPPALQTTLTGFVSEERTDHLSCRIHPLSLHRYAHLPCTSHMSLFRTPGRTRAASPGLFICKCKMISWIAECEPHCCASAQRSPLPLPVCTPPA